MGWSSSEHMESQRQRSHNYNSGVHDGFIGTSYGFLGAGDRNGAKDTDGRRWRRGNDGNFGVNCGFNGTDDCSVTTDTNPTT